MAASHDFPEAMMAPPDWLDPKKKYLIGVSGGRDSVFLVHWLYEHDFRQLTICHLNHQLRGEESAKETDFVCALADELDLGCITDQCDIPSLMLEKKMSMETAARESRHAFFAFCTSPHEKEILLAHHADDQAETILFRLLRGASGVRGMKKRQEMDGFTILRPMLDLRRSEITQYLEERRHPWCEDRTNSEPIAARNRLRNEAIPLLTDILKRDPTDSLIRAAGFTEDADEIAQFAMEKLNAIDPQGRLHLPVLREAPPSLQRKVLHHYLTEEQIPDLSSELITRCCELIDIEGPPALTLPGGRRLRRRQSRLFISE